jgi:hypothetical protein
MKLKFFIKGGKKVYTIKDKVNQVETKSAHYKFLNLKDVKENNQR